MSTAVMLAVGSSLTFLVIAFGFKSYSKSAKISGLEIIYEKTGKLPEDVAEVYNEEYEKAAQLNKFQLMVEKFNELYNIKKVFNEQQKRQDYINAIEEEPLKSKFASDHFDNENLDTDEGILAILTNILLESNIYKFKKHFLPLKKQNVSKYFDLQSQLEQDILKLRNKISKESDIKLQALHDLDGRSAH